MTFARPRAAFATALALAAFAAPFSTASTALAAQHYQQRVQVTCSGYCFAKFPKLAANQALDIDHVACNFNTVGEIGDAAIGLLPESLSFSMPLELLWQRTSLSQHFYTLGGEVNVRVPLGRQFEIFLLATGGTAYGSCSATGTLLTT